MSDHQSNLERIQDSADFDAYLRRLRAEQTRRDTLADSQSPFKRIRKGAERSAPILQRRADDHLARLRCHRDTISHAADHTGNALTVSDISEENASDALNTALGEAGSSLTTVQSARIYIAQARQAFKQRRMTARSEFDRTRRRILDASRNHANKTGGYTVEEWKTHSHSYLTNLGEAYTGPEQSYWSEMSMVALHFVEGKPLPACVCLSIATVYLEMWEEERYEFLADEELEHSCLISGDSELLQLCAPVFKLDVEQQRSWLKGEKSLAEVTAP
jgi:hypothetical protein